MADQSEGMLIYACPENSRGVVTGIPTDDWTVAEKTRQKASSSHDPGTAKTKSNYFLVQPSGADARQTVVSVAARNRALVVIVVVACLLISAGTANAITCQSSPPPSNKGHWVWRLIDNKKCWYAGELGMDKSKLHWIVKAPEPAQRTTPESTKRTAPQPPLHTEPTRSPEAQPGSNSDLAAPASDIAWRNHWASVNKESSAISIPAGSDAARTESHASPPAGDDSRRTNSDVSSPALATPPISDVCASAAMSSSYAENRSAAETPQPLRAKARTAERKRGEIDGWPSGVAFSLTMFTGALAIAGLLAGAILKLARRANQSWLQAFHQSRTNLAKYAGRSTESPPSVPVDDLESGLQDLIRDLRPTEIAGEEPQTLASTAPHDVPRRSYLRVMKVGEGPAMGGHESQQRGSRLSESFVALRPNARRQTIRRRA
jgi:hypothetical protein